MAEKKQDAKQEETVKDLKDLGDATKGNDATAATAVGTSVEEETGPVEREVVKDEFGRSYGTGRRKESIARVWLKSGTGKVVVNGKQQEEYFGRKTHLLIINQPFLEIGQVNGFDVYCTVKGGGLSGQAGAVRHGISRALEKFDPDFRPPLKKAGMMTRDARTVERKKIGKHKARRSKQWAKR